jgi:type II secretory pathway component PulC
MMLLLTINATLDGVQALIQDWTVTDDSNPSAQDVELWIREFTAELQLAVGDVTAVAPEVVEALRTHCRGLVHVGVAGRTRNAAIPERAYESQNSYGDVLLKQYQAELDKIRKAEFVTIEPAGTFGGAKAKFPTAVGYASRPL